jgi:hypothetical protein
MKLLPYVLAILMLLGLLTITSVRQTLVHQSTERAYVGALTAMRVERNNYDRMRFTQPTAIKGPHRERAKPKPDENKEASDEESENRWTFSRYDTLLDVNQLHLHQTRVQSGGTIDHYVVLTRLLRNLYSEAPWWTQGLEYRIADQLVAQIDGKLPSPDAIATVDMKDPRLQEIFYRMLKGGDNLPALLDFLTAEQSGRTQPINFWHAPQELLAALFDSPTIAQAIVAKRAELIQEMESRKTAVRTAERSRILQTAMSTLLSQLGANRAAMDKQLTENLITPRRSKYRYLLVTGKDPATGIEVKQRIRITYT